MTDSVKSYPKYKLNGPLVIFVATEQNFEKVMSEVPHEIETEVEVVHKSRRLLSSQRLGFDESSDAELSETDFGMCRLTIGDDIRTFYAFHLNTLYEESDRELLQYLEHKFGAKFIEIGQCFTGELVSGIINGTNAQYWEKLVEALDLTDDEVASIKSEAALF